ncbi:MAG: hypothetical protein ACT4NU_08240 [Chromatiales bacterium]
MQKSLVATFLLAGSAVAGAESLGFESIILDWPEGYQGRIEDTRIELTGPNGEHVTIMQFSLDEGASDQEAKAKTDTLRDYAETEMPKSAEQDGATIVRELKRSDYDDRHTLYSMVSERGRDAEKQYLLEYFLVGTKGGAYFSIVGSGDATPAVAAFDPVFAAVQWKE